jgi:hypothetical protein
MVNNSLSLERGQNVDTTVLEPDGKRTSLETDQTKGDVASFTSGQRTGRAKALPVAF